MCTEMILMFFLIDVSPGFEENSQVKLWWGQHSLGRKEPWVLRFQVSNNLSQGSFSSISDSHSFNPKLNFWWMNLSSKYCNQIYGVHLYSKKTVHLAMKINQLQCLTCMGVFVMILVILPQGKMKTSLRIKLTFTFEFFMLTFQNICFK